MPRPGTLGLPSCPPVIDMGGGAQMGVIKTPETPRGVDGVTGRIINPPPYRQRVENQYKQLGGKGVK